MKPNKILIKKILDWCVENLPERYGFSTEELIIDGFSNDEITFNVEYLYKSDYLDVIDASAGDGKAFLFRSITPDGFAYLDDLPKEKEEKKNSIIRVIISSVTEGITRAFKN